MSLGLPHPARAVERGEIDPARVTDWLGGLPPEETSSVITFDFVAPHGTPGLMSVTFNTPGGPVTL